MLSNKKNAEPKENVVHDWYVIFENQPLGPFSLDEVKNDPRLTPDTLVWKKGYTEWTRARFVLEFKHIFEDDVKSLPAREIEECGEPGSQIQQSQIVLALRQDPYQFWLWILLLLIVTFYTFYHFYIE